MRGVRTQRASLVADDFDVCIWGVSLVQGLFCGKSEVPAALLETVHGVEATENADRIAQSADAEVPGPGEGPA